MIRTTGSCLRRHKKTPSCSEPTDERKRLHLLVFIKKLQVSLTKEHLYKGGMRDAHCKHAAAAAYSDTAENEL